MKEKPILCFMIGYVPDFSDKNNEDFYGSEIALMNLSKYFKERYKIVVFGNHIFNEKTYKDIDFYNYTSYNNYIKNNDIDIIIISRYIYNFLQYELKCRKLFLWVHDVYTLPYFESTSIPEQSKYFLNNLIDKIDGIITLSDWHKNYFIEYYEINPDKVFIIGNGINVEDFKGKEKKIKNRFIWTSHGGRGLGKLIEYFPLIREEIPDAELFIYRDRNAILDEFMEEINKYDYIHFCGKLDNKKLIKEFKKSDIWFYPTNFNEGYCISALEAQMSELVCITSNKAALIETVGNRGILIDGNIYDDDYKEKSIKEVIKILKDDKLKKKYQRLGKKWASEQTWKKRSEEWYELFDK